MWFAPLLLHPASSIFSWLLFSFVIKQKQDILPRESSGRRKKERLTDWLFPVVPSRVSRYSFNRFSCCYWDLFGRSRSNIGPDSCQPKSFTSCLTASCLLFLFRQQQRESQVRSVPIVFTTNAIWREWAGWNFFLLFVLLHKRENLWRHVIRTSNVSPLLFEIIFKTS